jgi:catechol 2,3-dioxygenase-like lactoylglutathione lyase family enzyme
MRAICEPISPEPITNVVIRSSLFLSRAFCDILPGDHPRRSPMTMSVGKLDHYNVSTRKLKETVQFYENVLGLNNGARPPFNFPGAWLYSEGHPVLHINDISGTDREQRPDSGVIDHVAFGSRGFEAMKKHLAGKGIQHRVNQVPNSTRCQIFLRDPNNVEIELNYDTKNESAA